MRFYSGQLRRVDTQIALRSPLHVTTAACKPIYSLETQKISGTENPTGVSSKQETFDHHRLQAQLILP